MHYASPFGLPAGPFFKLEPRLLEHSHNHLRYGRSRGQPGGFDPAQVPTPVAAEQLFSDHGRGIFLISQMMDRVEFGHGGREIRMHKR